MEAGGQGGSSRGLIREQQGAAWEWRRDFGLGPVALVNVILCWRMRSMVNVSAAARGYITGDFLTCGGLTLHRTAI